MSRFTYPRLKCKDCFMGVELPLKCKKYHRNARAFYGIVFMMVIMTFFGLLYQFDLLGSNLIIYKQNYVLFSNETLSPPDFNNFVNSSMKRLNHKNFKFLIYPKNKTTNTKELLIMIISANDEYQRRKVIRNTIGRYASRSKVNYSTVFILGAPERNAKYSIKLALIQEENSKNGDILAVNITDTYEHLTEKDIGWMKWVNKYRSKVKYVLKIDDDTLINIPKFTDFFQECIHNNVSTKGYCKHISCNVWKGAKPIRFGKNSVTYVEYPLEVYPLMCQGVAYLIPGSVIPRILDASLRVPYLVLEDVYITGLLRYYIKEKLYPLNPIYLQGKNYSELASGKWIAHLISNYFVQDYLSAWIDMMMYANSKVTPIIL